MADAHPNSVRRAPRHPRVAICGPAGRPGMAQAFLRHARSLATLQRGGRIDSGGPRGRSECSVERGEWQPHPQGKFQIGRVINRQTVLIGKRKHCSPHAYRGYRLNLDG